MPWSSDNRPIIVPPSTESLGKRNHDLRNRSTGVYQQYPPGPEANKVLEPGSETPKCWWASVKLLAANEYNLAAGRYKPTVSEAAPEEDPADLIREVLDIERDITKGLERLLTEVESC